MDLLTVYGLVACVAMVLFYAIERVGRWTVLCFSISCVLAAVYGYLQGAWPFALVEAFWSIVAFVRYWRG